MDVQPEMNAIVPLRLKSLPNRKRPLRPVKSEVDAVQTRTVSSQRPIKGQVDMKPEVGKPEVSAGVPGAWFFDSHGRY